MFRILFFINFFFLFCLPKIFCENKINVANTDENEQFANDIKNDNITNLSSVYNLLKDSKSSVKQLLQAKEFLNNYFKNDHKVKSYLHLKILINSILAKKCMSIDNDGFIYLREAIESINVLQKISGNDKQYLNFCNNTKNKLYIRYLTRLYKYYLKGDNIRSMQVFEICKKIDSKFPHAYLYLAMILQADKQYDKALKNYYLYQKFNGKEVLSFLGIAKVLIDHQGDYISALKVIDDGLKIFPYNVVLIKEKVSIINKYDDLKNYIAIIKSKKYKKRGAKFFQLAFLYKKIKNNMQYKKNLLKAVSYSPRTFNTNFYYAIENFNNACKWNSKLNELIKSQKKKKEIQLLKKAIKQNNTNYIENKIDNLNNKISNLLKISKKYFEKACYLKPNHKIVENALKRIEEYTKPVLK